VVPGATHESLVADRRHAAVVADAVRTVVATLQQDPATSPAPAGGAADRRRTP